MTGLNILEFLQSQLDNQGSASTKYESLSAALALAITEKVLLPGESLPSERKLAEQLGISRITVRNSIDSLVSDGLLVRRQGVRTTVAQKVGKQISNLIGFSEDMKSRGLQAGAQLLSTETEIATALEREKLDLCDGDEVVRLRRVRLANDQPIAVEMAVVPLSIVKSAEAIGPSLYASLHAMDKMPDRGIQRISAETIDDEMAQIIDTRPGTPVLVVERCCKAQDGTPVEFTTTYYNAEIFEFITELQR
ncbi:hypothetical protein AB833_31950 [Chromatiales bacterium (ex Bugula neritina AB1)]|nr:hypothetical protein AB833_31950 [Chromatiales bacterium (ex Bugula neritina AB1)]